MYNKDDQYGRRFNKKNKIMNFIKNNLSESKKKINVVLTFRIDESYIKSSEFAHFKIVDFSDVLLKNNYHPEKDSELNKLEFLSKEIINSEDNIIIYNTGLSLEDFDTISELLKPHELIINNILVPNEAKRQQQLADGQRAYSCLLYTSPSPRDATLSRMPSSA